jgi:hypothetical protein
MNSRTTGENHMAPGSVNTEPKDESRLVVEGVPIFGLSVKDLDYERALKKIVGQLGRLYSGSMVAIQYGVVFQ